MGGKLYGAEVLANSVFPGQEIVAVYRPRWCLVHQEKVIMTVCRISEELVWEWTVIEGFWGKERAQELRDRLPELDRR